MSTRGYRSFEICVPLHSHIGSVFTMDNLTQQTTNQTNQNLAAGQEQITAAVDTHSGLSASGEQRDFHSVIAEFRNALRSQLQQLIKQTSNLNPSTIAGLELLLFAIDWPDNEQTRVVIDKGVQALFVVFENPRFYNQFAGKRFDRYIMQTVVCRTHPEHQHDLKCLKYRLKGAIDEIDFVVVPDAPGAALEPIVEPEPLQPNAGETIPRLLLLPPSAAQAANRPNRPETPPPPFPDAEPPCYECGLIMVRDAHVRATYHNNGHAVASLQQFLYGLDWRWSRGARKVQPPFRANAGEMKKQREIDLRVRDEKRKRHLLVAAWNNLDKKESPKRSVKDRNREFKEALNFQCNGLVDKAKRVWNVFLTAEELLDDTEQALKTVKSIKDSCKDVLKRMLPHIAGLFARWLVQPPNFWALCIDLFVLIERICPEKVKYTFDQLMIKAIAYKNGLQSAPIDANSGAANNTAAREALEKRFARYKANAGKKEDKRDENLTKSSFLTLLAELITGFRLKDRTRWTMDAAMAFGKTMRDVNTYRKATLEVVTTTTQFLSKYIKCAMWQKMFENIPSKADLAKFVQEVEAIQAYSDAELNDVDFPAQMDRLFKTAVEVRALLINHKLENTVAQQLNAACGALSRFRARHFVRIQRHSDIVRTVPYVITLVGKPGVHKSDTATLLAKEMCHPGNCNLDIGSADINELIYYYSALKFCDGYCGQPVFFWDDQFQKENTVSTSSDDDEHTRFIRWISNAQISLPMAQVDEKGRWLSSPLFITTSNHAYPNPKSCTSEAVQRRRNILCYVTVDKSYECCPEEAIEYTLPDGTTYKEQSLQYMKFHILPSVARVGGVVVGDTNAPPMPEHNDPNGLSYTQFLRKCVEGFNAWQGTSSNARMRSQTPAMRVFGTGAGSLNLDNDYDRMNPKDVPVRVPYKANGGAHSSMKFEPKRLVKRGECLTEDEIPVQDAEQLNLQHQQQCASLLPMDKTQTKVNAFLYKHESIKNVLSLLADYLGMPFKFIISLMRNHLNMFLLAALLALLAGSVAICTMLFKGSDFDVLIPSEARKQFVEQCHPAIQDELDNMLIETTLSLEEAKLRANMSAQGYERAIMKGKAARVTTKPAHLQRMEDKINFSANAGHANNVAVELTLYNNIRSICLKDGRALMQAIGICGQWMVVTAHFFQYAHCLGHVKNGKCLVRIGENGYDRWSGEIDMQLVRFIGDDVALFKLPKQCKAFRDIRKHFVRKSEFAEARNIPVRLLSTTEFTRVVTANATLCCQELTYDDDNVPGVLVKVAEFYHVTHTNLTKGDCGGPMIIDHLNRVAGIHSASNGRAGIVAPVWREMFDICQTEYTFEELPDVIEPLHANGKGNVEPVGLVPPQWNNHVRAKTDLIPSPIQGKVCPVQKEPSVKSLKDVRISEEARKGEEPIWKSFSQYFDPVHDIPSEFCRKAHIAIAAVLSIIQPTRALERRVLNEDEVLNGTRDGTFPSLNIHTSAGMPQRLYAPGKPGKTAFFVREADDRLSWGTTEAARKFKRDYEYYENCLKVDVVPFVMLTEQLKDETLKLSKISDAKTRTFEVFPGPLALVYRKYFGAFNAAMQKDCADRPISVGINPHSVAWKLLYSRLNKYGGRVIAGDYVAWDKRLCGQAIYEAVELVNEWYDLDDSISQAEKKANAKVRLLLAVILIHSNVVVQNIMYQTEQGLPSGVPITSVLNSVANWLYLYAAIFQVLDEKGKGNKMLPHELNDHVELALYGDDHIVALDSELREDVTFRDIRDVFLGRRVGYTDANKNKYSDFDFENLTDVTFLKRKFDVQGSRVYAPLDLVSVEDQLNWINRNKTMNDFAVLAQCFHGFQIEAHLHGKPYFDQKMKDLRAALNECTSELKADALCRLSNSEYSDHWSQYNDQYSQV